MFPETTILGLITAYVAQLYSAVSASRQTAISQNDVTATLVSRDVRTISCNKCSAGTTFFSEREGVKQKWGGAKPRFFVVSLPYLRNL